MSARKDTGRLSQISTAWTLLRQVHAGSPDEARAAQELILMRYRGAVYRYLRKAVGEAEAEDLTQEFSLTLLHGGFRHAKTVSNCRNLLLELVPCWTIASFFPLTPEMGGTRTRKLKD